ncbi:hypothetical protein [Methylobacter sp.]|uniref:hypothetical protein n=1 Tax=Methylobacter sp. TaxID=2051955 RepID=UPI002FDD3932
MSALAFSTALRNSRAQCIAAALDAGATPGKILLYTAPRPATGAAITTQTLIGTCMLSDPCGTVSNGVLVFDDINDDDLADATGVIAWARGVDGDDAFVLDMSCGIEGSGAALIFNTLSAQMGGAIQILSGSITEGNV